MTSRRDRRTQVTVEVVIETALNLLAEGGVHEVTVRKVAEALGQPQSAVTVHTRTTDDLLSAVLQRCLHEIPLPTSRGTWQQRLMRYGRVTRAGLLERPGLSSIALAAEPAGPGWLFRAEWLMRVLRNAGLPDRQISSMVQSLTMFVVASVYGEERRATDPGWTEQQWARRVGDDPRLPANKYPTALALAPYELTTSERERFEIGLRLLVDGIAAQVPEPPVDVRDHGADQRRH